VLDAVTELQRRGDIVVRSRDLQLVIEALHRAHIAPGEDQDSRSPAADSTWRHISRPAGDRSTDSPVEPGVMTHSHHE
jgi:hypothetical protein